MDSRFSWLRSGLIFCGVRITKSNRLLNIKEPKRGARIRLSGGERERENNDSFFGSHDEIRNGNLRGYLGEYFYGGYYS